MSDIDNTFGICYFIGMQKELKQLGLDKIEAEIYLACLELGPATPTQIAKKAEMKRPTIYLYLDRLTKLGLISRIIKNKKRLIVAEEPERLKSLIQRRKEKIKQAEAILKRLIPQLKAISASIPAAPKVSFYEGQEGIWNVLYDILKDKKDFKTIGSFYPLFQTISEPRFYKEFTMERLKQGTSALIITDKRILKLKNYSWQTGKFRIFQFIEKDIDLPAMFILYGNKIGMLSFGKNPSGTIIQSKEIISLFNYMFDFMWDNLKEK